MNIQYWKDPSGQVHGIDSSDPRQLAILAHLQTEIPGTWTDVTGNWPAPPTLAQAQAAQSALIDKAYAATIQQPVAYMGTTFQADTNSQTVLTQTVAGYSVAGGVPTGFWWLDANNNKVPMTLTQLQGLAAVILAQGWTAFQHRIAQKKAIAAAASVAAVQAITW